MRVKMLRTIEIPHGDRHTRLEKGALVNMSESQAAELTAGDDPAATVDLDQSGGQVICFAVILSTTDTDCVVRVTASAPADIAPEVPGVRLEHADGVAVVQRPDAPKYAPSGAEWTFARPAAGSGNGSASFSAQCTGFAPSAIATVEIPAQGAAAGPQATSPRRSRAASET